MNPLDRARLERRTTALAPRLAIGVPAQDMMWTLSFRWILGLLLALPAETRLLMPSGGTTIARKRNEIVRRFLEQDHQWLLFLDSDMLPPPDLAARLLAHNVDICGALYFNRGRPHDAMAVVGGRPLQEWDGSLVAADRVGTAAMLIRRRVLEQLAEPWFEGNPEDVGEDWHFCKKARAAGFSVHVDTATVVGHVGVQVIDAEYLTTSWLDVQRSATRPEPR